MPEPYRFSIQPTSDIHAGETMRRENRSYWTTLPSDLVDTIIECFVQGRGPRLGSCPVIKWVVLVEIPVSSKLVVIGERRTIVHRNGAPVTAGDNGNLS